MGNIVCNIAKGRGVELYKRVVTNDPANCAILLIPLETAGLEDDAVLKDVDTVADLLAGTTNEQTDMGRKILTDAELAALPAPDDANDKRTCPLPDVLWPGATGDPISKVASCFVPDTTSSTDAEIELITIFDFPITPTGVDVELKGADFYQAS